MFLSAKSVSTASEFTPGSPYTEHPVQSFARAARTPILLQAVIDELRPDVAVEELAQSVTATVPTNTATIDLASRTATRLRWPASPTP